MEEPGSEDTGAQPPIPESTWRGVRPEAAMCGHCFAREEAFVSNDGSRATILRKGHAIGGWHTRAP